MTSFPAGRLGRPLLFGRTLTLGAAHGPCPGHAGAWLALFLLLAGFLAACLPGSSARAEESTVLLDSDQGPVRLAGHLSVYRDAEGTATIETLAADPSAFTPLAGDFNVGYSAKGAWWLRVRLMATPDGAGTWYLAINAPFADVIDVYAPDAAPDGSNPTVHKRMGGLLPVSARDLRTNTQMARIVLEADEETEVYLRLSGARSLSATPTLWRLPAFVRHLTLDVLMAAIAVGAAAITCIGALTFGLWLGIAPFVWYGAYVGATALVFLSNSGFLALMLENVPPSTVLRIHGMVGCLSIMTGAFMIRSVFCPPGRLRIMGLALAFYGALAGASVLVSAAGYYSLVAPALMSGVLLLALILPILAALRVKRREPAAWWYFVGFSGYSIATLWFALVVLGFLPPASALDWGHQTVGLLHMAAVFGGLAAALRAGMRERRILQARLLSASERSTHELERAVTQRTAALEAEVKARKEAEAALRVALREQRNFLVMVSHEFRTPLATVRAAIAIIERGSDAMNERLQKEAGKIVRAVGRLSSLIDTFLTEDLVNKATMRLEWGQMDFALVVRAICRDRAAESARAIHVSGLETAPIMGDQVLLSSVVENLVGNALKHSEADIFVSLGSHEDGVWLQVADTGPGIDPAEHEAIFERYYRSPTAGSRPGAGIGLNIVRRVVEMHGGEVDVDSARGKGSTFSVWLPRHRPSGDARTARPQTVKA
ncbi:sensor histidine kinase [Aquabacter cavernae]|uniref:sensor histidine kinase n=1 Tax=Aquabacter cavernae TaxID=2496029 RepID=UPI000F8E80A1|nr:sensor histidine kinase [Aquabacter cavernae]